MSKLIGIVGGMGPYSALDVNKKIFDNTLALSDKEHLNVALLSFCSGIPGRTKFLMGETLENPASSLAEKISPFKVDIIAVACHTFHTPPMFDVFEADLQKSSHPSQIIHLPNAVKKEILKHYEGKKIAVLSTVGTYELQLYQQLFNNSSVQLQFPDLDGRKAIQEALLNPQWGIKRKGTLSTQAKLLLEAEIAKFYEADALLLACTELPLIIQQLECSLPIIDPNLILARALIEAAYPQKLKR